MRNLLPVFIVAFLLQTVSAGEMPSKGEWKIFPTTDRGHVKEYIPTFEKHFKVESGVLKGSCGLGAEFYKKYKCGTFRGVGNIWATDASWPTDLKDFELTFDYKWFQDEPMKKFGDFPDMNVGIRLNKDGKGYVIQWGFLGQIRPQRMGGGVIGLGSHRGLKGKWAKVRILAVGPIIKVKVWAEMFRKKKVEEPKNWNVEVYDNWAGTDEKDYQQGAIALGFQGRKLFDTCVYEYRNVKIRRLTADEAAKVKFFDEETAPRKYVKGSSTINVKTGDEFPKATKATIADAKKDDNAAVDGSDSGVTIQSTDGKPAFAWKGSKGRLFTFRAKSSKGARPILGVKVMDKKWPVQVSYLDPLWRDGIAAVLYENENHTANSAKFVWKDDTEYEFIVQAAHWLKWQIREVGDPKNRVNFSAKTYKFNHRTSKKFFGIGAAGKAGTVTVTNFLIK